MTLKSIGFTNTANNWHASSVLQCFINHPASNKLCELITENHNLCEEYEIISSAMNNCIEN